MSYRLERDIKEIPKYLVISKTLRIFAVVMRLWRNW